MHVGVLTSSLTTRLNPGPLNQDVNLAVLDSFCDMSCHPSGVFLSMGDKGAEVSSLAQPDLSTDTVSESHPSGHPPIHLHLHSPTYPLPIHQPVHLLCLSIHPSPTLTIVHPSIHSSYPSTLPSTFTFIHPFIGPSPVRPSISTCIHPPTLVFLRLSLVPPSTCPSTHPFKRQSNQLTAKGICLIL